MMARTECPNHRWAQGRPYCYEVGPERWNGWRPSTTPRWEAAVTALRDLLTAEGWARVSSAYAEATHRAVLTEFKRPHQLRPSRRHDIVTDNRLTRRPWEDHTAMFETPAKQPVYTTQPYDCGWDQLSALVDFARQHHLEAEISARDSWHFPGHTLLITLAAPGARRFAHRPGAA